MTKPYSVRLFYSYSHKDARYRTQVETVLANLRRAGVLSDWSDRKIMPGQHITPAVRAAMKRADILVFLLSPHFIASDECMKEWHDAKRDILNSPARFRVPIILTNCAWRDLLVDDDLKALPNDAKPVTAHNPASTAWQEVYEGVREVALTVRNTFVPKDSFLTAMERTELISQDYINLSDIFVFLTLSSLQPGSGSSRLLVEQRVTNIEQLLSLGNALIHGDDMSGKTALARHLFLSLARDSRPVMLVDLKENRGVPSDEMLREIYSRQFSGDYTLWRARADKTIVIDNLSSAPQSLEFLAFATERFERTIVLLASDIYLSFYRDELRVADFTVLGIESLTHSQQEELIRRRLELMTSKPITDGFVDQVEARVNSVVTNRLVPRYPFYVLSTIQTYEGFMPSDVTITSHGHCYYVMVLARLLKAGIDKRDETINVCFNFAEHLAFAIYQQSKVRGGEFTRDDFDDFVVTYRRSYIIHDSVLNRLKDREYGLLSERGHFRVPYMHYYFLGLFLSKRASEHEAVIEDMCQRSHLSANYLTLLFVIHHAIDDRALESILLMTMCALDRVPPATLHPVETRRFRAVVEDLSAKLVAKDRVESERRRERVLRDEHDANEDPAGDPSSEVVGEVNDWYRILRNNEMLGHVLRNKYGRLRKERIEEIVETVADGGLRLVNSLLKDEAEIHGLAEYIAAGRPTIDVAEAKQLVRFLSFVWTIMNVEGVVAAVSHPEIREIVRSVVGAKSTPAYDIIGYFSALDGADGLTESLADQLERLRKRHDDPFVRSVLSLRTQHYMNTHRSKATIEQRVCSLLRISYQHRLGPRTA